MMASRGTEVMNVKPCRLSMELECSASFLSESGDSCSYLLDVIFFIGFVRFLSGDSIILESLFLGTSSDFRSLDVPY